MREQIDSEVLNYIKKKFESLPEIKEIKFSDDKTHIEVWLNEEKNDVEWYDNEFLTDLRKKINEVLKSVFNLEIGGVGELSNFEEYMRASKEYDAQNPMPVDPSQDRDWKKRSYYDRTKGKGAKEYANYKNEMIKWRAKKIEANLPPRDFPGFTFNVEPNGFSDKVFAFYSGTKYFGD